MGSVVSRLSPRRRVNAGSTSYLKGCPSFSSQRVTVTKSPTISDSTVRAGSYALLTGRSPIRHSRPAGNTHWGPFSTVRSGWALSVERKDERLGLIGQLAVERNAVVDGHERPSSRYPSGTCAVGRLSSECASGEPSNPLVSLVLVQYYLGRTLIWATNVPAPSLLS